MERRGQLGILLTLGAAMSLGGCIAPAVKSEAPAPLPSVVALNDGHSVYECSGNLYAVDQLEGAVLFHLSDHSRRLTQVSADSDARYEDDAVMFWLKGDDAQLSFQGGPAQDCDMRTDIGPWEMAQLRHVSFRAIGEKPGWALEITNGRDIRFVGDRGQTDVSTEVPPPITEPGRGRTEYYATKDGHDLGVIIEDGACTDTMSGEEFEAKVAIELDGKDYMGCGRAL